MPEHAVTNYIHVMGSLSGSGAGVAKAVWELSAAQAQIAGATRAIHLAGLRDEAWTGTPPIETGSLRVHACGPRRFPPGYSCSPELGRIVSKLAAEQGVIHSHGLWIYPNHAAARIARKFKRPHIISPHGMMCPWSFRHSSIKKIPVYRLIEKGNLKQAACLVASSQEEARDILNFNLGVPVATIPFGINIEEFPDPAQPMPAGLELAREKLFSAYPELRGKRILLFLGRIHPVKAPEQLLGAWIKLAAQFSEWHLVFAGPDADETRATLEIQGASANASARITFLPAVQDATKLALLRASELLVLPSHNENFGFVIPEALASGTTILASDRTPWGIVNESGCGWTYPFGEAGLTAALEAALSETPEQLRARGLKGRELVRDQFDWDGVARRFHSLYDWIIGDGQRPEGVTFS